LWHVFLEETVFTWIFITVICHTKYEKTLSTTDGFLGALVVAITLFCIASMIGAEDGGCFNPTIGLTESTMMLLTDYTQESSYFKYIVAYIFGPLAGGFFAAIFTYYVALRIPLQSVVEMEVQRKKEEVQFIIQRHASINAGYEIEDYQDHF
jgi:glycerol uptake facilitator-like aquaporin